jgi:protein-tyrosine phosphatase
VATPAPDSAEASAVRRRRHLVRASIALVVVAFVLWLTVFKGKRMFFPRNFGVVEEGAIYRSGQLDAFLVERTLEKHGIDLVIDLARDDPADGDERAEKEAVARLGIRQVQVQSLDGSGAGDPQDYVTAMEALLAARKADQQVLVHCAAGSERTGALVAMYRMLYQGWEGDRAYEEYLSYRASEPKTPKLSKWMHEHLPQVVQGLVEKGLLDPPPQALPEFGPYRAP